MSYQGRNFGFTPPQTQEARQNRPEKAALPAQLIPPDSVHTGDGWIWKRLADGSVQLLQISPVDGTSKAGTTLSPLEWTTLQDALSLPDPEQP